MQAQKNGMFFQSLARNLQKEKEYACKFKPF